MRLLYLTDRLSHRGGAPNHLIELVEDMSLNNEVVIASSALDRNVSLPTGVKHIKVSGLRAGTEKMKGLAGLPALIEATDLVHIQNIMNPAVFHMAKHKPCVVTVQDHRVFCPGPGRTLPSDHQCSSTMDDAPCNVCLPNDDQRLRMSSITKARQDALRGIPLIVLSAYMADEMEMAGFRRPTVIPPQIRVGPTKQHPGDGFLIAGRLVHHKGIDLGYQAWKSANTNQPLRIAGLGPAAEKTPDAQNLGWLSSTELQQQIRSARALIFPSRWQEPYGIIGVEALTNGTPVIGMKRGGMGDWMETGSIQIQPGDVHGMTAAIETLAKNPQYALKLGQAGQSMMRHRQQAHQPVQQIRALYDEAKSRVDA